MPVIKSNINNALSGVNVSDADAAAGDVTSGKTFYSGAPPIKTGNMVTPTGNNTITLENPAPNHSIS